MNNGLSDEELVIEVAKGNEEAFRELYRRFEVPIFNYLDRLVFDKHALEDLFQNVFVKVF